VHERQGRKRSQGHIKGDTEGERERERERERKQRKKRRGRGRERKWNFEGPVWLPNTSLLLPDNS
jgi:hypothetical protein